MQEFDELTVQIVDKVEHSKRQDRINKLAIELYKASISSGIPNLDPDQLMEECFRQAEMLDDAAEVRKAKFDKVEMMSGTLDELNQRTAEAKASTAFRTT